MVLRFVSSSSWAPVRDAFRRQAVALGALALGLTVTAIVATLLARAGAERERAAFASAAAQRAAVLDTIVHDEVHDLESLALLTAVTPHFDFVFFRNAARFHQQRRGAVGGLIWMPRVPHAEREAFEAAARAEGFEAFRIADRAADGGRQPASARAEYLPNLYREPFPPGRPGHGVDVLKDPLRRSAIEVARDSGRTSATGRVDVLYRNGARDTAALQAFYPVYHGSGTELPSTLEERRARFRGVVSALLPAEDLFDTAYPGGLPSGWTLRLATTVGPDEQRVLLEKGPPVTPDALVHETLVGPNELRVAVAFLRPTPGIGRGAWGAIGAGVIGSLLLTMLVATLEARREDGRRSAERLREMLDACPDVMVVKDSELRFRLVNRAFCKSAGVPAERAIGRTNEELFGDVMPPHVREKEEACLRSGEPATFEFWPEVGAASRWYEAVVVPLGEGARRDGSIVVTVRDISARKALERARDVRSREALAESEARFRALALLGSDWFWEQDAELRFVPVRDAEWDATSEAKHLGDWPIGLRRWEVEGFSAAPDELEAHRAALDRREPFRDFEYSVTDANGGVKWFCTSGEPVFGADGEFRGYRGTARNITGERRREATLRESEARFRALADMSSDWYWEQDANCRFTAIGSGDADAPAHAGPPDAMGRTRWELPGLLADEGAMAEHRATVLERHAPFRNFTYGMRLPDGSTKWFTTSGDPVFDDAGAFRGYRGTGRDITERRRAAEIERELSEQRRAVLENLLAAVIVIDERGTIETFSRQAEAIFGYAAHEVIGRNISMLMAEPHRGRHDGYLERYARTGERRIIGATRELYGLRRDGSEVPIELGITEIVVDGRRKYTGMVRDLTARRAAQAALAASEERFRGVFDNNPEAVFVQGERRILMANPAAVALLGAAGPEQLIGRQLREFLEDDRDREDSIARGDRLDVAPGVRMASREYRIRTLDGASRRVEAVSTSYASPEGLRIITTYRDVTAVYAARVALVESEDRFRRLFDVSPDGVILHDGKSMQVVNPAALRIFGATAADPVVGRGVLEFFVDDADRRDAQQRLDQAQVGEGVATPLREWRVRALDGVERYAESSTIAIPGSQGTRFMSVVRETTARRRADEEIRRSEARLREVMDLVPHFIFVKDRDGRYLMTNRAYAEYFRHTPETIVGKAPADLGVRPEEAAQMQAADARVRETGAERFMPDQKVTGPDGREHTYSTLRIPFRFSDAHPDAVLAVSIDITDIRESERRLREILDVVPHPIYAKDREGRYLLSNRAHAAFYGRTPEEIVGSHGRTLAPNAAERAAMAAGDGRVLESLERDYQPDVIRTDAAGRTRRLNLTKIPFSYFGGEADSVLGISIDITDLVEAHAKVRESLVLLEATLESTDNGFLVTDAAGRIVRWNHRFLELFDVPVEARADLERGDREALLDRSREAFAAPEEVREAARLVMQSADYEGTYTAALKDGRFVERYTQPMMRDGLPAGRVWSYRDVTARERERIEAAQREAVLERRVDERTAELKKAVDDLTLFTSAISHDLRAPLRAVGGFVDMAIEDGGGGLSPDVRRHLERVLNAVRNMSAMVEGMLALARQSRAPIHRQPVDVAAMARETFEELVHGRETRAELRVAPCPPADADPVLLRNVVQNLLGNALKYSRNREHPLVEVGAAEVDGRPAWFVRDNGAGFDPKYADKLFQPFGRLHSPREFEGTGIGLAAVHRILDRHGGRIWAESRPGEGATFWFTLS